KVRLAKTKQPLLESEEKLFALPDVIDEENGPYADLLDHITRLRVKLLNDLLDFEEKLTVDEVEDQLREAQNSDFIDGKAAHLFHRRRQLALRRLTRHHPAPARQAAQRPPRLRGEAHGRRS